MTCELINPRTDERRAAKRMRNALKNKPCACIREWTTAGYVVTKQCEGCAAIEEWDWVTEALT